MTTTNPEKNKTIQTKRGYPAGSPWRVFPPKTIDAVQTVPSTFALAVALCVDARAFNKVAFFVKKPAAGVTSYVIKVIEVIAAQTKDGAELASHEFIRTVYTSGTLTGDVKVVLPAEEFMAVVISTVTLSGGALSAGSGFKVVWRGLNSPTPIDIPIGSLP